MNTTAKIWVIIMLFASLIACDKGIIEKSGNKEIITERVNDTIFVGYNQVFSDLENNFRIQIDSVLSDSRCPIGVQCCWEGNAEIRFQLKMNEQNHVFNLNTYSQFRRDTLIHDIMFKLVGVEPYPVFGEEYEQEDYKVKIITSK